jgi:tetratricopeptide (TPR) repeat protein
MKRNLGTIMLLASIVFIVGLQGCTLKTASETKSLEKFNTVQNVENPQPLQAAPTVDPVKAAESERCFDQGLKLYEQYQYQEAVTSFDKAIAANPANYKAYTSKGIALCFEGNYQAGMELIQKTLDIKPDYVPAFYDMAMAYKLQKNYDKSLFWFEKTIQGDPQNTWSYYGIATIYADRANTKDSLAYLKKAIELDQGVKAVAKRQSHFDQMRNMPEFQALVR